MLWRLTSLWLKYRRRFLQDKAHKLSNRFGPNFERNLERGHRLWEKSQRLYAKQVRRYSQPARNNGKKQRNDAQRLQHKLYTTGIVFQFQHHPALPVCRSARPFPNDGAVFSKWFVGSGRHISRGDRDCHHKRFDLGDRGS